MELTPGAAAVVSIRPHQIELVTERPQRQAALRDNLLRGRIRRASYLGDTIDFVVEVEGSDLVLRVSAPASARLRPGDTVTLGVAQEVCVPLTEGGA